MRTIQRPQTGFTLIELMIVVAIVAILGAIAYPSYQEHVRSSRRSDCLTVISSLANAMERRYSTSTPASYLAAVQIPPGFTTCPTNPVAGGAFYDITMPVATATTFTIRATPAGTQVGEKCGSLTLTHAGVKGIDGAKPGVTVQQCW